MPKKGNHHYGNFLIRIFKIDDVWQHSWDDSVKSRFSSGYVNKLLLVFGYLRCRLIVKESTGNWKEEVHFCFNRLYRDLFLVEARSCTFLAPHPEKKRTKVQ